jgi:hypothetical protein
MVTEERSYRNSGSRPMTVWLEPWAMDFALDPGEELRVVGIGEQLAAWEVVEYPHCVAIYVPVTAYLQVFADEKRVLECPRFSDEEMPGPPVRYIVENLFGGPGGPKAAPPRRSWWQRLWPWGN